MCRNLSYSTAQRFYFICFEKFIDIFELPVTRSDPHELCQTKRETVFYYFLDMFSFFFLFSVLANFDDHFSIFIVIQLLLGDPTHLMRLSDDILYHIKYAMANCVQNPFIIGFSLQCNALIIDFI